MHQQYAINGYLKKTETVRKSKQFLVSFKAPHYAVKTKTDAGLAITVFTSHSTRSSSASKAHIKGLSLTMINKSAGWTTNSTFV